jgi:peptidoglycan/xylan/chitin deacetylase (PgdA/CDA1 family)
MTLPPLVTVGSHSVRHYRMTDLDRESALSELLVSRRRLEEILGHPVTLFAFPYGAHDERLVSLCAEAGYERVFSVVPTPLRPDSILVGRVSVSPEDGPVTFALKVRGGYDWLPAASRIKRRLTARMEGSWEKSPVRPQP